jgi:suppressor for copper-sensitivity B
MLRLWFLPEIRCRSEFCSLPGASPNPKLCGVSPSGLGNCSEDRKTQRLPLRVSYGFAPSLHDAPANANYGDSSKTHRPENIPMRRPRTYLNDSRSARGVAISVCIVLAIIGVLAGDLSDRAQAQENASGLFDLGSFTGKPAKKTSSAAKITLERATAKAGDVVTVKVVLDLPKGSHTYSLSKGFSGRTRFEVKTATGVDPVDADFVATTKPKSKADPILQQTVETHEGLVVWTRRFRLKAGVAPESVKIAGEMRYQVCDATSCRPKREKFELALRSGETSAPKFEFKYAPTRKVAGVEKPGPSTWTVRLSPGNAAPGEKVTLSVTAKMVKGYHTFALDQDRRNFGLPTVIQEVAVSGLVPIATGKSFKPNREVEQHKFSGKVQRIHHDEVTWTRDYTVAASAKDDGYGVSGKVSFQICDANSCRPGRFTFALGTVSDTLSDSAPPTSAPNAKPTSTESSDSASVFDELNYREPGASSSNAGIAQYLLFAFLGGLILNVMPCVLPVIAIKVLSFVQQAGEDRGRIFLLNATYSLGVISVFMLLATLAVFAGTSWGGQFQSVEFLVAMSALVFVMGLSLLGVFEIPLPGFVGSSAGGHQEGLGGAFMTGIFATILATPCSGPFLGPTLGWSIQQSSGVIYMIWGMMGLGMASPYLLFGLFPGAVRFLPKPGNWMIRFKQIAGFIMLGTTVFLLSILDESYLIPTLVMLLGIGLGVWMIGNLYTLASPPATRWKVRFAALCTVGLIGGYGYQLAAAEEKILWEPFTPAAVADALKNGQPVMVDFTADWCLTCKVVEKTTLDTDSTRDVVNANGFVTLKADWTDGSDEIRDMLNRLGGDSIPTLAVFSPARPAEPIVLRDAWTQSTLLEQLQTVVTENQQPVAPSANVQTAATR